MIYLIGGPPKCGKTTLAKQLAKSVGSSWISTDTFQNAIKPYIAEQEYAMKFPASSMRYESNDEKYAKHSMKEIIVAYRQQAETVRPAIERFVAAAVTDRSDYIMEGYHIEPKLVAKLTAEFPNQIKGALLVKKDTGAFLDNIHKNTIQNDWVQTRTKQAATFPKIADMVIEYGLQLEEEARQKSIKVFSVDDFDIQLPKVMSYLLVS